MQTRTDVAEWAAPVPSQRLYWDRWHEQHTHASHREHADRARDRFASALHPESPCAVLELGCGQGRDASALASAGHVVYGLDHSDVALGRAALRAASSRTALRLMAFDYSEALPFPDQFFDGVYAHLALHYFDKDVTQGIVDDVLRVLRPGGVFYFTVRSTEDRLYGEGYEIDRDMFCRHGHVRHFFDVEFTNNLLLNWTIKSVAKYDRVGEATNSGNFIEGLAVRRDGSEPQSVRAELVKVDDPIPSWEEVADFFVWEAFDRASAFPCLELGDDALQQQALLAHTDNFYVVPDQFGVVSGHVLVLPKERASSIASLDANQDLEIVWLLQRVSDVMSQAYDARTVMAEHGECGCDSAGQAHVHVLPVPTTVSPADLTDVVDRVLRRRMVGVDRVLYKDTEFTSPEDMRDLLPIPEAKVDGQLVRCADLGHNGVYPDSARSATGLARPYVYFRGVGVEFTSMSSFRSQFVREVVSQLHGLPEGTWDRRVFVDRHNMFDTYRQLVTPLANAGERRYGFTARGELSISSGSASESAVRAAVT